MDQKELLEEAYADLRDFADWRDAEAIRLDRHATIEFDRGNVTTSGILRDTAQWQWERRAALRLQALANKLWEQAHGQARA